jgi:tetratricopeptide (TPR) repeat protein
MGIKYIFGKVFAKEMKRKVRFLILLPLILILGCGKYYISSVPGNAKVYIENPRTGEKYYLGVTPLKVPKSKIDLEEPFYLVFEKGGYETAKVPVAPIASGDVIVEAKLVSTGTGSEEVKFAREVLSRFYEAQKLVAKGKYHEAIAILDGIIRELGDFPEVYMLRGSIYRILKDDEKAIADWKKASELNPKDEELSRALSDLLKEKIKEETKEEKKREQEKK